MIEFEEHLQSRYNYLPIKNGKTMPSSLTPAVLAAVADDGLTARTTTRHAHSNTKYDNNNNNNQFKRRRRKGRTRTRAQVRQDCVANANEEPFGELCRRQIRRQRCFGEYKADCDEQVSAFELRECPSRITNRVEDCFVERHEKNYPEGTNTNILPQKSILPQYYNCNGHSNEKIRRMARFSSERSNCFSYSDPKKIRCFLNKNRANFYISIHDIVKYLALIIIIAQHCMFIVCSHASFVQSSSSDGYYDAKSSISDTTGQPPLAPQPLVYRSFEFGSGDSYSPYSSNPSTSSSISSISTDQSYSSVSPALIEAKCWNNYADDNDCKHLNVITAPNGGMGQQQQYTSNEDTSTISLATDAAEDDSIITPVVIFESTSPMNELYPNGYQSNLNHEDNRGFDKMPTQYDHNDDDDQRFQPARVNLAPPYSPSTTTEPSSRHHQQQSNYHHNRFRPSNPSTTANDVYSAPSATATVLPDSSMIDESGDDNSDENNSIQPDADSQQQPVTKPTAESGGTGVFVGTPRPKFKLKTTTSGRKCRDENDADCDEPEDVEDDNDNGDRSPKERTKNNNYNSKKNNGNNRIVWKFNPKTLIDNGMGRDSNNDNNAVGTSTDAEDGDDDDENKVANGENGSGGGDGSVVDDNEDGIDDDTDGSSGNGSTPEVPLSTVTGESFFTTSTASDYGLSTDMPFINRSRDYNRQPTTTETPMTPITPMLVIPTLPTTTPSGEDGSRRVQTNAEIEVIVHSTLPPSFPITTQPSKQESDYQTEDASSTLSISTLPDDTVTSKPIFPPPTGKSKSGDGDGSGNNGDTPDDNNINENDADQSAGPTTTMDSDLDTFKPIPMQEQWPERSPLYPFAKNGSNSDGNDGDSGEQGQAMSQRGNNNIASRFKFEPPSAGGRFNDMWQHPTRSPNNPIDILGPVNSNDPASNTEQSSNGLSGRHRSSASTSELTSATSPHRAPDVLPTMILYAAIIIIATTALIFVTTAFIYYWRSNARRQALLHKTNLMNGATNPQISPFMSHPIGTVGGPGMPPAPMMAAIAQPGSLMAPGGGNQMHPGMVGPTHEPVLLSTYAPGKGVNGGRVTTGLVRQDMGSNMLIEEDGEQNNEEEDGSIITVNNNNNTNNNNSNNNNLDNEHVTTASKHDANAAGDNYCMQTRNRSGPQHQSSWSTNEESGGGGGGGGSASASGTGVSSGSRTECDSQQTQEGLMPLPPPAQTGVMVNGQQQPPYGPVPHHQEQHHQQQPQQQYPMRPNFNNSLSDERQNSSSISDSQCSQMDNQNPIRPMQPMSQEQHTILPPPGGYDLNRRQHYNGPPDYGPNQGAYPSPNCGPIQMMMPAKGGMAHSRSIEDLRHQQMQPDLVRTPQPYLPHLNRQQTMPSPRLPHIQYPPAGAALFKQQQLMSMANSSCSSTPTQITQQRTVYFPSPSERYSSNYSIGGASQNGLRGPPSSTMGPAGILGPQSPPMSISPRRVAMNPLATLGKRGLMRGGLNRNIYSEDSSSLLTTSPSLVRTSSSSSFAFNTSQTGSIRAKPLLDASGHIINDYTQSYSNQVNGVNAPPVFGRKGRSDAWYV